jgi:tetratricopeptide (TPR) repeat protein
MLIRSLSVTLALAAAATASAQPVPQAASSAPARPAAAASAASAAPLSASAAAALAREAELARLLDSASRLLAAHKAQEAIAPLDQVIAAYEAQYRSVKYRVYSARTEPESAVYVDAARKDGVDAVVVTPSFAYAYSMKAFALLELKRLVDARVQLEKALALAPQNARVLTELGTTYQIEKNWTQAEQIFTRAVDAARLYSPAGLRKAEMAGALRGVGYVFIEQGRLDDAEKMFKECIRNDANDQAAKRELDYIAKLRDKKANKAP